MHCLILRNDFEVKIFRLRLSKSEIVSPKSQACLLINAKHVSQVINKNLTFVLSRVM